MNQMIDEKTGPLWLKDPGMVFFTSCVYINWILEVLHLF